jgi:hypothetical protein
MKNGMDVICMACGFYRTNEDFWDKIHRASGQMLIFAAPTNEGNVRDIAYPARYVEQVFCIFSTDGNVKSSQINPTKAPAKYNFAILGENILNYRNEQKSGTSLSTAIAAGLAGRLLDFSRHADSKDRIRNAWMMKAKYGMTKVLLAMTTEDKPYHCIKPWKLVPSDLRNEVPFQRQITLAERKEARNRICTMIENSLDGSEWERS